LVLFHNHSASNLNPSKADQAITGKITNAGKFLDIALLDPIIITETGYYSFANEGRLR
jgi:DNA repair protein RadC